MKYAINHTNFWCWRYRSGGAQQTKIKQIFDPGQFSFSWAFCFIWKLDVIRDLILRWSPLFEPYVPSNSVPHCWQVWVKFVSSGRKAANHKHHPYFCSLQQVLPLVPLLPRGAWRGSFCTGTSTNHISSCLPVSAEKATDLFKWTRLLPYSGIPSSKQDIPSSAEPSTNSSLVWDKIAGWPTSTTLPLHTVPVGAACFGPGPPHAHPGAAGPHLPGGAVREQLSCFTQDLLLSAGRGLLGILIVLSYLYFPIIL